MNYSNQKKALHMARHAYETVPLYREYAENHKLEIQNLELEEIPIMDKSFFLERGMATLSTKYVGKYLQNKLIHTRTSGSTGTYTEVFWDGMEKRKSLLPLWLYRKRYYGITPKDKMCYFYPSGDGSTKCYEKENRLAISKMLLIENKLEIIFTMINKYQPKWMILQPSFASILCNYVEKNQVKVPDSICYIEFTGEYLDESIRMRAKKIFHCKTANQYGSKEVNSIAYECPHGNLHIMSNNVFIEIIGDKEEGDICLTTLQNRAMPLVRFNIGDRGKLRHDINCACGNQNSVLELRAGRNNDWIVRRDGTKIHAYQLMQIVEQINLQMDGEILQFQIVQKDWDEFVFHFVIEDIEMEWKISDLLLRAVRKSLGEQVEVAIQYHDQLMVNEKTGKLACFYCDIKN